jgi:hypothetical protein
MVKTMPLFLRSVLAWLAILGLAILNGALRQGLLLQRLGDRTAHIVSTLLLSILVLTATWVLWPWLRPASSREAWLVGVLWVLLTVAFEFLAGHYVFGTSWKKLLGDYNVAQGRVWLLVLITTLLAPLLVFRLRGPHF